MASLPVSAVRVLEAYSRGVNAFLRQVESEPAGRGAPELFLFSTGAIERWTPADSIGVIKLMSLRLSGDAQRELEQGRFASLLPRSLLQSLYPPYPDAAVVAPGDAELAAPRPSDPGAVASPEPGPDRTTGSEPGPERTTGSEPGPDRTTGSEPAPEAARSSAAPTEEAGPEEASGEAAATNRWPPEGLQDVVPAHETVPQEASGEPVPTRAVTAEEVAAEENAEEPVRDSTPEAVPAPEDIRQLPERPASDGPLVPWSDPLGPGGSNSWAADGSRSTSTKPLLANDPHLGLSAPGVWYLARLRFQNHDVIGATIPGLPIIVAGRKRPSGLGLNERVC